MDSKREEAKADEKELAIKTKRLRVAAEAEASREADLIAEYNQHPEQFTQVVPKSILRIGSSYKPIPNTVVIVNDSIPNTNYVRKTDIPSTSPDAKLKSITSSTGYYQAADQISTDYNFDPETRNHFNYWVPKPSFSLSFSFGGGQTRSKKKNLKRPKHNQRKKVLISKKTSLLLT